MPKRGRGEERSPHTACPGLYLIVQTSGTKSWALRFRRPTTGKSAKLTLGPLDASGTEVPDEPKIGDPLTLAAARTLAAAIGRQRVRGRDVVADHAAAKSREKFERETKSKNTFVGGDQLLRGVRQEEDEAMVVDGSVPRPQGRTRRLRDHQRRPRREVGRETDHRDRRSRHLFYRGGDQKERHPRP